MEQEIRVMLIPREDGGLRVCSEDMPGLILSGRDPAAVMADVWPAILVLRQHNRKPEATFTLDITEGKSRAELADDYHRCSRAAFHWQQIAMCLIEASPEAVDKLPPEFKAEIERLIEAYKD